MAVHTFALTSGHKLRTASSAKRKPNTRREATQTNGDANAATKLNGTKTNSATIAVAVEAG
jgi:hypothetical protein